MKRFSTIALLCLLILAPLLRAQSPDDQFVRIYNLIQQADDLKAQGQSRLALERYRAAQEGLLQIQKVNPNWNPRVVTFRLKYIAEKAVPLQALEAPAPTPPTIPAGRPAPTLAASN